MRPDRLSLALTTALLTTTSATAQRPRQILQGQESQEFGTILHVGGDFDGDGVPDLINALPHARFSGNTRQGILQVRSGVHPHPVLFSLFGLDLQAWPSAVSSIADIDGDGRSEILAGKAAGDGELAVWAPKRTGPNWWATNLIRIQGSKNSGLGRSVTGLGDLDGDGFDDFAAGSDTDGVGIWSGRWVVHKEGPEKLAHHATQVAVYGLGDVDADGTRDYITTAVDGFRLWSGKTHTLRIHSTLVASRFASCGDVNGDGFDDVILGLPSFQPDARGRVFVLSGQDLSRRTWRLLYSWAGDTRYDHFGTSLAGVGDVDSDGVPDLAVGAVQWNIAAPPIRGTGYVRVFSGATGLPIRTHYGLAPGDQFGFQVCGARDFNGDGRPELLISSPGYDAQNFNSNEGLIWVYEGRLDVDPAGPILAHRVFGAQAGDRFGHAVVSVGDVNRDGWDDIAIGASATANNGAGYVEVYSGLHMTKLWGPITPQGVQSGDAFGQAIAAVGDTNKDGYVDILVGAPDADPDSKVDAGMAFVLSGRDGSVLQTMKGDAAGDHFGFAVSGLGDLHDDNYRDLLVGAPSSGRGYVRAFSGVDAATLYTVRSTSVGDAFGRAIAGIGDVNDDGRPDFVVGAAKSSTNKLLGFNGRDGTPIAKLTQPGTSNWFAVTVAAAGDTDGDGVGDILVGDYTDAQHRGTVTLLSGKTGSVLRTLSGRVVGAQFGVSMSTAGDSNGDGYADFVIGAHRHTTASQSYAGRVALFSGKDFAELASFEGDARDENLGISVTGGGDFNGDGFDDIAAGACADQNASMVATGSATLYVSRHIARPMPSMHSVGSGCTWSSANGTTLPRLSFAGRPALGGSFSLGLTNGPRVRPAQVWVHAAIPPALDLTPIGAPGCRVVGAPLISLTLATSNTGEAGASLLVPKDTSLLGVSASFQWAIFDSSVNALGIVWSDSAWVRVGAR